MIFHMNDLWGTLISGEISCVGDILTFNRTLEERADIIERTLFFSGTNTYNHALK